MAEQLSEIQGQGTIAEITQENLLLKKRQNPLLPFQSQGYFEYLESQVPGITGTWILATLRIEDYILMM